MNNKRFFIMYDISSTIGTFITLLTLYSYLCLFIAKNNSSAADLNSELIKGGLIIALLLLTDYISRSKCKNVFVFTAIHLLNVVPAFFISLQIFEIIVIVCIWFFTFYSAIEYWKTDALQKSTCAIVFPGEMIILYIGVFFHCYYGLSKTFSIVVYIFGIIFYALTMANKYFSKIIINIQSAEGQNKSHDSSPYKLNTFIITLFTGFIFLFSAGLALVFSDTSFNFVGKFFQFIGRKLVSLILLIKGEPEAANYDIPQAQSGMQINRLSQDVHQSSPLLNAIFNIVQVAIYVGLALLIIYSIYMFFRSNMHKEKFNTNDDKKESNPDKVVKLKKEKRRLHFLNRGTNAERIRKMYKRKINHFKKGNITISDSDTPKEISIKVYKSTGESLDMHTKIYEKARYSNIEITKDDVAYYKNLP